MAIVVAKQLEVELGERLARDGLAALRPLVDLQLEIGEERLPEEGLAQAVEGVPQQREPGGVILGLPEHVVEQQVLVEGRGHLGHEDGVFRGLEGLVLVGEVGVH